MTGTLYGTSHYHWAFGFFFGAALGAVAAIIVTFKCKRPTVEEMEVAVRAASEKAAAKPRPVAA
jgi:hypothetical protein